MSQVANIVRRGPGQGTLFVSQDGSGSGSGSSSANAMSLADFMAMPITDGMTVSFAKGETFDFSQFTVPAPASNPTDLRFTDITTTTQRLDWTRGPGDFILIVRRTGAAVTFTPDDDTSYTVGQDLGDDQVVMHNGSGIFYPSSSLTQGVVYHYAAWEYNTNDEVIKYCQEEPTRLSGSTWTTEFSNGLTYGAGQGYTDESFAKKMAFNEILKIFTTDYGIMAQVPRLYITRFPWSDTRWKGVNWKSASTGTQGTFTSVTHEADGSTLFNGTSSYFDMQWTPSTGGASLFTATDAGWAQKVRGGTVGSRNLFGVWKGGTGPANFHVIPSNGGNMVSRLNNLNVTGVSTVANTTVNGIWIAEVRALNTAYVSVDDTVLVNGTVTGVGVNVPNVNFVAMARNNAAAAEVIDLFMDGRMDFCFPYKATTVDREDIKDWWEAAEVIIDELLA